MDQHGVAGQVLIADDAKFAHSSVEYIATLLVAMQSRYGHEPFEKCNVQRHAGAQSSTPSDGVAGGASRI